MPNDRRREATLCVPCLAQVDAMRSAIPPAPAESEPEDLAEVSEHHFSVSMRKGFTDCSSRWSATEVGIGT